MTKHTQGGWNRNIKPASKYNVIYAGRNTHVAALKTDGLSKEEIEANCNLIAAAPDLLEALKEYIAITSIRYEGTSEQKMLARQKCKAAINKAEGN